MKKRFNKARNLVFENKMFKDLTFAEALNLRTVLKINSHCIKLIWDEYKEVESMDLLRIVKCTNMINPETNLVM